MMTNKRFPTNAAGVSLMDNNSDSDAYYIAADGKQMPRLSRCRTDPGTSQPAAAKERKLQTTTFRSRLRNSSVFVGRNSITQSLFGGSSLTPKRGLDRMDSLHRGTSEELTELDLGESANEVDLNGSILDLAGSLADLPVQEDEEYRGWMPNLGWLIPWKDSSRHGETTQQQEDEEQEEQENTSLDARDDPVGEFINARLETFWSNIDVLTGGRGLKYHVELDEEPDLMETSNNSSYASAIDTYAEACQTRV